MDRTARLVRIVYRKELLLHDRLGQSRIEILDIAIFKKLATGSEDSRARYATGVNRIPESSVSINSRMAEVANSGESTLEVLTRQLRAHQDALGGRLDNSQQQIWSKEPIVTTIDLGLGRNDHV